MTAREEENLRNLKLSNEATGFHHGQMDATIIARLEDGRGVGYLDYSVCNGEASIKMVEVLPEMRRRGIGMALVEHLQEQNPAVRLNWGMTTVEGTKLRRAYNSQRRSKPS